MSVVRYIDMRAVGGSLRLRLRLRSITCLRVRRWHSGYSSIRLKLSIVTLSRSSGVPMNPCTVRAYVDFDVEEAPQV